MTDKDDPRAWLKPFKQQGSSPHQEQVTSTSWKGPKHVTHGLTQTMAQAGEFQCCLTAVMHPHTKSGYKDKKDPCNRSDKRNGGDFRRFESSYRKDFASVDDKPIQFREDGLPISARMVPGKPLMAPKMPYAADLTTSKRLVKKYNHESHVCIGNPGNKDPCQISICHCACSTTQATAAAKPRHSG